MFRSKVWCFLLVCTVSVIKSEDLIAQINLNKRPINHISDKFLSFSIDPINLLDNANQFLNQETLKIVHTLGPSYIKLTSRTPESLQSEMDIPPSEYYRFYNWLKQTSWVPIISLNYSPQSWQPRETLKILGLANKIGIKNCVWQLGSDLNATDIMAYMDDLSTLKVIVGAFKKQQNEWGVIGADVSSDSDPEEVRTYAELSENIVDGIGWLQPPKFLSHEHQDGLFLDRTSVTLRNLLKSSIPIWMNINTPLLSSRKLPTCANGCVVSGLSWAQMLGDAARNGFDVIFKQLNPNEMLKPSLSYFITRLHKQLMGNTVFESKLMNGDKFTTHIYTQCSREIPGGFVLMMINMGEDIIRLNPKITLKSTGAEIREYILSVKNSTVTLNGMPMDIHSALKPAIKIKRSNGPVTLQLPPFSVGFWEFTHANVKECMNQLNNNLDEIQFNQEKYELAYSSSDVLLQELIAEAIDMEERRSRPKRSLPLGAQIQPRLKNKFKQIPMKRWNLKTRSRRQIENWGLLSGAKKQNLLELGKFKKTKPFGKPLLKKEAEKVPPVTSTVVDAYKPASSESEIFRERENDKLPNGDVQFEVGKGKDDADYEYVSFDEDGAGSNLTVVEEDKTKDVLDDVNLQKVPDTFFESFRENQSDDIVPTDKDPKQRDELFEAEAVSKTITSKKKTPVTKANVKDTNIDYVVRELQPTFRQNQMNLRRAHSEMQQFYAEDDNVNEDNVSGEQIASKRQQTSPYVDYDLNENDSFFVSEEQQTPKAKRYFLPSKPRFFRDPLNLFRTKKAADTEIETEIKIDKIYNMEEKYALLDKLMGIIDNLEVLSLKDGGALKAVSREIDDFEKEILNKYNLNPHKNNIRSGITENHRRSCKNLSLKVEQECIDRKKKNIMDMDTKRFTKSDSRKIRRKRSIPMSLNMNDITTNNIIDNELMSKIPIGSVKNERAMNYVPIDPEMERFKKLSPNDIQIQTEETKIEDSTEKKSHIVSHQSAVNYSFFDQITQSVHSFVVFLNNHISNWWEILETS